MRFGEAIVFLCIASGLHAAVWSLSPLATGTNATAGTGQHEISIAAASASQQAMVASWLRPPEAIQVTPRLVAMPAQEMDLPNLKVADIPFLAPLSPVSKLNSPASPVIESAIDTSPPPPGSVEEQAVTRPRLRPGVRTNDTEDSPALQNRPERQAKGAAGQVGRGDGGQSQKNSKAGEQTDALQVIWAAKIHARIQHNLRYPKGLSNKGTAKLVLTVSRSGKLEGFRLVGSSGDKDLDNAAIGAVKRSGRFAKAPEGLVDTSYTFSLLLTFNG